MDLNLNALISGLGLGRVNQHQQTSSDNGQPPPPSVDSMTSLLNGILSSHHISLENPQQQQQQQQQQLTAVPNPQQNGPGFLFHQEQQPSHHHQERAPEFYPIQSGSSRLQPPPQQIQPPFVHQAQQPLRVESQFQNESATSHFQQQQPPFVQQQQQQHTESQQQQNLNETGIALLHLLTGGSVSGSASGGLTNNNNNNNNSTQPSLSASLPLQVAGPVATRQPARPFIHQGQPQPLRVESQFQNASASSNFQQHQQQPPLVHQQGQQQQWQQQQQQHTESHHQQQNANETIAAVLRLLTGTSADGPTNNNNNNNSYTVPTQPSSSASLPIQVAAPVAAAPTPIPVVLVVPHAPPPAAPAVADPPAPHATTTTTPTTITPTYTNPSQEAIATLQNNPSRLQEALQAILSSLGGTTGQSVGVATGMSANNIIVNNNNNNNNRESQPPTVYSSGGAASTMMAASAGGGGGAGAAVVAAQPRVSSTSIAAAPVASPPPPQPSASFSSPASNAATLAVPAHPIASVAAMPPPSPPLPSTISSANHAVQNEEISIPVLPKVRPLPPLEEGETPHFNERNCVPLAIEEDANWLSDRQCFIRADLLEVIRASHQDVLVRSCSKKVAYQQVGIRCRFCAHLHPSSRAVRSSAFPSSIHQMYQSFTMMVRDHWSNCTAMPPDLKRRFMDYQDHKIPSSSLSREYWAYAAKRIGMVNTSYGITISQESLDAAEQLDSFGTTREHIQAMQDANRTKEALVHPSDKAAISPFVYELMTHVEICYLTEMERVGKKKDAPVGLSGFGCSYCIAAGRLGFCRVFPLNKRSLSAKVNDLYAHFQRCPLTPVKTRKWLRKLKSELKTKLSPSGNPTSKFAERDREFIDQIWSKLGRKGSQLKPTAHH